MLECHILGGLNLTLIFDEVKIFDGVLTIGGPATAVERA